MINKIIIIGCIIIILGNISFSGGKEQKDEQTISDRLRPFEGLFIFVGKKENTEKEEDNDKN